MEQKVSNQSDEVKLRVLTSPEDLQVAFAKTVDWADSLMMAYAWAGGITNKLGPHWKALDLGKISVAVIGVHFAQTEPTAIRRFMKSGNVKLLGSTRGTFHPKLLLADKGRVARVLLGSSNFTSGGFSTNTEVNVLMECPKESRQAVQLRSFIESLWDDPAAFEPDEKWLNEYEESYESRPDAPKLPSPPNTVLSVPSEITELNISWNDYCGLIESRHRFTHSNGLDVYVFDNAAGSYLQEIEKCRRAFERELNYAAMSPEDRKLIAGFGDQSWGYLGRMSGAPLIKKMARTEPEAVGEVIDRVPLTGAVSIEECRGILQSFSEIKGVKIGVASRLLAVKRPDLFLPVNSKSDRLIARMFDVRFKSHWIRDYLNVLEQLWAMPWYKSGEPVDERQHRLWKARVALLDALFYEPDA